MIAIGKKYIWILEDEYIIYRIKDISENWCYLEDVYSSSKSIYDNVFRKPYANEDEKLSAALGSIFIKDSVEINGDVTSKNIKQKYPELFLW